MKRRNFLKSASALSAPFLLGGVPVGIAKPLGFSSFLNGDPDRKLVIIQLTGGNDGLNTVMQLNNYDTLANLRSNILIPENQLLQVTDEHAFHPSMNGIRDLYDQGAVHIIQNVAYPNQNRSHFRSTDIWSTASDADEFLDTGWVGRYMEDKFTGYPDGYPNSDCPDPLALTVGNFTSETCQGTTTNFSIAVSDLDAIRNLDDPNTSNLPDNCYGEEMSFLIESIITSNAYASRLTQAADAGNNLSSKYIDGDNLAEQLMTVAKLISGGLETQIYIVSLGGFDTHANQVDANDPTVGVHANLWESVSEGVCAFLDDMKLQGLDDNIVCMTFSEFGRQIRSNGSLGTDHGTAAPLFLFGNCIEGGIFGDNIEIPANIDPQDGVPMQFDFRDIYGTVLERLFNADEQKVRELIYDDYQRLNIFPADCYSSTNNQTLDESVLKLWPNPSSDFIHLEFIDANVQVSRIEIFNGLGARMSGVSTNQQTYSINIADYPAGQYVLRLRTENGFVVKRFLKMQ